MLPFVAQPLHIYDNEVLFCLTIHYFVSHLDRDMLSRSRVHSKAQPGTVRTPPLWISDLERHQSSSRMFRCDATQPVWTFPYSERGSRPPRCVGARICAWREREPAVYTHVAAVQQIGSFFCGLRCA